MVESAVNLSGIIHNHRSSGQFLEYLPNWAPLLFLARNLDGSYLDKPAKIGSVSSYDILSSKFLVLNFQLDKNIPRLAVRIDLKNRILVKMYVGRPSWHHRRRSRIQIKDSSFVIVSTPVTFCNEKE